VTPRADRAVRGHGPIKGVEQVLKLSALLANRGLCIHVQTGAADQLVFPIQCKHSMRTQRAARTERSRQRHIPVEIRHVFAIKNQEPGVARTVHLDFIERAIHRLHRRKGERRTLTGLRLQSGHVACAQQTNGQNSKKLSPRLHCVCSPFKTDRCTSSCGRPGFIPEQNPACSQIQSPFAAGAAPARTSKRASSLWSREEPPTHSVRDPTTVTHCFCAVDQY